MSTPVEAFGRGKLILCGEHAVVYGYPALAFAVDLGTTARVHPHVGPTHISGGAIDPRINVAAKILFGPIGHRIELSSTLPIGRGMGSSAALAVALAKAKALMDGDFPTDESLYELAMPVEECFHSNPSGLDVAISIRGGVIRFKKAAHPVLTPVPCPKWQVVVIDSGSAGNTSEMVRGVGSRRPGIDPHLEAIGALVGEAEQHLNDPTVLGGLLDENHRLLKAIGVSTPILDELCDFARAHGALGAKLTGSGGGGVIMALVDDPNPLLAAASENNLSAWLCQPQES